jgi:hypothetical protein
MMDGVLLVWQPTQSVLTVGLLAATVMAATLRTGVAPVAEMVTATE